MQFKKILTLAIVSIVIGTVCFCMNETIVNAEGEGTSSTNANFGDVFVEYTLKDVKDDEDNVLYRTFEYKRRLFSRTYYDFIEPGEIARDENGNEILPNKKRTPYRNYISYSTIGTSGDGRSYNFTQYGGSGEGTSYLNYVGVNFEMKELPDGSDGQTQNFSINGQLPVDPESNPESDGIEWKKRVWNSLQVSADSNAAPTSFDIMHLGEMRNYRKDRIYMLVAQSAFASQTSNTDYVYWGTAILAYLRPIEPPAVIIAEFTDRVPNAKTDITGQMYYHNNSEVVYCLTIQPMVEDWFKTTENSVCNIKTSFITNNETIKKNVKVVAIEYARRNAIPGEEESYGEYYTYDLTNINLNSINPEAENTFNLKYEKGIKYKIYFKLTFDLKDEILTSSEYTRNFTSNADIELRNLDYSANEESIKDSITASIAANNTNYTLEQIKEIFEEEIDATFEEEIQARTSMIADVTIYTLEERGNL